MKFKGLALAMCALAGLAANASAQEFVDNCGDATNVGGGTYAFDLTDATTDGSQSCGFPTDSPDKWVKFTPTATGNATISTCGLSEIDTMLSAFDACGGIELACNDDACGLQSRISVPVTEGVAIYIRVARYNGTANPGGSGQVTISDPVTASGNDSCSAPDTVTEGTTSFDNSAATLDGFAGCITTTNNDIWFSFTPTTTQQYDITACGSSFDTVVSVFTDCSNVLACNDDNCGLQSIIPNLELTAGTPYLIRVAAYFNGIGGPGVLNIGPSPSIPPEGFGFATPETLFAGTDTLLEVVTTPGVNPASTTITVSADLSGFGGSSTQTLYDDGSNGDIAGGDGTYSYTLSVPAGTADGDYTINFTVADEVPRSSTGTIFMTVTSPAQWDETINGGADAGDMPSTAAVPTGSGSFLSISGNTEFSGDADMFRIDVCDAANFSATTANGTTLGDTQIWLFKEAGLGVTFNDDSVGLLSTITSQFVVGQGNGVYYLAVSRYDNDPVDDAAQFLWIDTPFAVERAPDGPGAFSTIAGWSGTGGTGTYRIDMTGVCFAGGGGCVVTCDFNQDGGGDNSDVFDLADSIASGTDPFPASCKDFNQDGGADNADIFDMANAIAGSTCP